MARLLLLLCCCQIMAQETIFFDDFERGELNPVYWSYSDAGMILGDMPSGIYAVEFRGTLDLHLDLSGHPQAELDFDIGDLRFDDSRNGLWFSEDGVGFKKIFNFYAYGSCWGRFPPIDLDELIHSKGMNFTSQSILRFRSTDRVNIDNVRLTVPRSPTYATLPYREDFESGRLDNHWRWRFPRPDEPQATSPCGLGAVTRSNLDGHWGLELGLRSGGYFSTNAFDLHLNLMGQTQIQLELAIAVNGDDNDFWDDILFSDDGGINFKSAFSLQNFGWAHYYRGRLPPIDVDQLAQSLGLNLSERFVIRFRQRGTSSSTNFFIDEVKVVSEPEYYATLPFSDGFEAGKWGSAWHWGNPYHATAELQGSNGSGFLVASELYGRFIPQDGFYALAMGNFDSAETQATALDLRLELADYEQVICRFQLYPYTKPTRLGEAIFLSADGGLNFVKIHQLDGNLRTERFNLIELDLTALARARGLTLTDRSVLRIQHTAVWTLADAGYIIDDVSVIGTPLSNRKQLTAVLPWIVDNQAFQSRIALYNDNPRPAAIEYLAVDSAGQTRTLTATVAGKSLVSKSARELFPGMNGYALLLYSDRPELYPSYLTFHLDSDSGLASPSQTEGIHASAMAPKLIFGYLPGDEVAALALTAPQLTAGSTRVLLSLLGEAQQVVVAKEITLEAKRPLAILIKDLFPGVAIPRHTALRAESQDGQNLAGTTFVFNQQSQPSMATAMPLTRSGFTSTPKQP